MRIFDFKRFERLGKDMEERGTLTLYALLERETKLGKWDLIVSAPWVKGTTIDDMQYVHDKMKKWLTKRERDFIGHVVLLQPEEPAVKTIIRSSRIVGVPGSNPKELDSFAIHGMPINHGYILSSTKPPRTGAKASAARTSPGHS